MSKHRQVSKPEKSPQNPDSRRRLATRAAGAVALTGALVTGAFIARGEDNSKTIRNEIHETASAFPKPNFDLEIPHPQKAADYYYSKERDNKINAAVIAATAKIIADVNSDQLYPFTFRPNGDAMDTKHKPGWGQLEHYASDGQFPHDVIISAYRNPDGTYASKNGVELFTILLNDSSEDVSDWTRISFLKTPSSDDPKVPASWSATVDGSDVRTISSSDYALNIGLKSADELQGADETALKLLPKFLEELDI